jgi:HD-GYP domain-containing protein (c-di-GMP phosphodiesterase class II)
MSATPDVRLAELVGALSLATDLGMGQPLEQALRTCLLATRLGEEAGLGADDLGSVYYGALLRYVGCTSDAHEAAALFGDEISARAAFAPLDPGRPREMVVWLARHAGAGRPAPARLRLLATALAAGSRGPREAFRAHCEVARRMAERLGLGAGVRRALGHAFERWDGGGFPAGLRGEAIAVAARVIPLARDAEVIARLHGPGSALAAVRARGGAAYDPALASLFAQRGAGLLRSVDEDGSWQALARAEPEPARLVPQDGLDGVCAVMADFADLASPYTVGHSAGVADLAEAAGWRSGLAPDRVSALRRAALLHDLGRVGVSAGIWGEPGPLDAGQWERVRLHPYYTERIVMRVPALAPHGAVAGAHHERLDGSGYPRGSTARDLGPAERLLAAADVYHALTERRPHRPARAPAEAAASLGAEVAEGRIDADAAQAVLAAAGQRRERPVAPAPAGLSEREVQVLGHLARGRSNRRIGELLGISPKTVGHHVAHVYAKIGVSTRAGATLFAAEHGLVGR